jgi:hypothetical protein
MIQRKDFMKRKDFLKTVPFIGASAMIAQTERTESPNTRENEASGDIAMTEFQLMPFQDGVLLRNEETEFPLPMMYSGVGGVIPSKRRVSTTLRQPA